MQATATSIPPWCLIGTIPRNWRRSKATSSVLPSAPSAWRGLARESTASAKARPSTSRPNWGTGSLSCTPSRPRSTLSTSSIPARFCRPSWRARHPRVHDSSGVCHSGRRLVGPLQQATRAHRVADLVEDRWIVDGGRQLPRLAVGDLAHGATQDLARARLGQALYRHYLFEGRYRADLCANEVHDLAFDLFGGTVDARIEHDEAGGNLALHCVRHADHRTFGHILVLGDDLLHLPGR